MAQQEALIVDKRGAVEWVSLNRPEAGNALNADLIDCLVTYFENLRDREDVRIVVLGASGKHFCVGLDLADNGFAQQERTARERGRPRGR